MTQPGFVLPATGTHLIVPPGQPCSLGLPQASTALFPKQRAFQASKS